MPRRLWGKQHGNIMKFHPTMCYKTGNLSNTQDTMYADADNLKDLWYAETWKALLQGYLQQLSVHVHFKCGFLYNWFQNFNVSWHAWTLTSNRANVCSVGCRKRKESTTKIFIITLMRNIFAHPSLWTNVCMPLTFYPIEANFPPSNSTILTIA